MKLSPADLTYLVNLHVLPDSAEMPDTEVLRQWINDGIVVAKKSRGWELTDRGVRWLEMILATPYPIRVWVDPREKQ